MQIALITPAKKTAKTGNRASTIRWARMLRAQGHQVQVNQNFDPARYAGSLDLMVALHAYRSAASIARYRQQYPRGPLIVVLGGTDFNSYLHSHPERTMRSMASANALLGMHDLVAELLPRRMCNKLTIIRQSATTLAQPRVPRRRTFDICVVGQLRKEKDPLRSAFAARMLPTTSKLRIIHLGGTTNRTWENCARKEMARNPRYVWRDEVPGWQVKRELLQARAMIISSNQEGGANIVGEAVVAGVPVIASDITGNRGLLGTDYPGYYAVGDTKALAELLVRAENDPKFLRTLAGYCAKLAPSFSPEREARSWAKLINSVVRRN